MHQAPHSSPFWCDGLEHSSRPASPAEYLWVRVAAPVMFSRSECEMPQFLLSHLPTFCALSAWMFMQLCSKWDDGTDMTGK